MRAVLVVASAVLALVLVCARSEFGEQDVFVEPDLSGSVRLPLVATGSDGISYALRDLTVEISGAAMVTLTSADGALESPLPAGEYSLFVRPGFTLFARDESGAERPLQAQLARANPQRFRLGEREDATLKLTFVHDGREIVFGKPRAPAR